MRGKLAKLIRRCASRMTAAAETRRVRPGHSGDHAERECRGRELKRMWNETPRPRRRRLKARIRAATVHLPNRVKDEHNEACDHDQPLAFPKGQRGAFTGTCRECGASQVCSGCRSADGECYCKGE